ncbi:cobalt-precorrin-6A reductase [Pseudohoeflea suaedae]|uniref:Cobalt-precorrin-6A reductase n=1 Tax=Pseudohoeflea suaedae TaxID=877384 RepID=A0A4R5PJN1_9HYPH|nr:cobalt-precorrin-6A reductase [Pseudohoeflea suaedae]TDH35806.1 cobalt-precorrin-6A reductase [Pseudohoeflea suaedae]
MTETILILGGTREAAELAARLVIARPDARLVTSLAGRTKEPSPLSGEVRIGGFGGAEGLAQWLTENHVSLFIDATHPFAKTISDNAVEAAGISGVPLYRLARPSWSREDGDRWIEVESLEAARDAIPPRARVFLALGSQHIAAFEDRDDAHFVVRMIDQPERKPDLRHHTLVLGRPGDNAAVETILFLSHAITHIVCRNSGGKAGYAKIEAARRMGLPVIMIERPVSSRDGYATIDDLIAALP